MDADNECYVVLPWMEEGGNSSPSHTKNKSQLHGNPCSDDEGSSNEDQNPTTFVVVEETHINSGDVYTDVYIKEEIRSSSPECDQENRRFIRSPPQIIGSGNTPIKIENDQEEDGENGYSPSQFNNECKMENEIKVENDDSFKLHERKLSVGEKNKDSGDESDEESNHGQDDADASIHFPEGVESTHFHNDIVNTHSQNDVDSDEAQDDEDISHSQMDYESNHSEEEGVCDNSQEYEEHNHSKVGEESSHSQEYVESSHSQEDEESGHSQEDEESGHSQEDEHFNHSQEDEENNCSLENDEENDSSQENDRNISHSHIVNEEKSYSKKEKFKRFKGNKKNDSQRNTFLIESEELLNEDCDMENDDDKCADHHPVISSQTVRTRKKRRLYSRDDLAAALHEIRVNGLSILKASSKFGIPNTILIEKLNSDVVDKRSTHPALTYLQEKRLSRFVKLMCDIGYSRTKKKLPKVVKELLDNENVVSPSFINNEPPRSWVDKFLSKFKLAHRMSPEEGYLLKSSLAECDIRNWFNKLEKYLLEEHGIVASEFLCEANSHRIFNCDERGFPFVHSWEELRVLMYKGRRNAYHVGLKNRSEQQISVIGCIAANGYCMKPFVVYPGNKTRKAFSGVDRNQVDIKHTPNGLVTVNIFYEWLTEYFYKYITRNKVNFPVILFIGGYYLEFNVAVVEFCLENNIILCLFPPYADMLQPLDVAVYGPMKTNWNEEIIRSFATEHKPDKIISYFFKVFWRAFQLSRNSNVVKDAFRKSGLIPYRTKNFYAYRFPPLKSKKIKKERNSYNSGEKMGIKRCINIVESIVPKDMLGVLMKRLKTNYDGKDETFLGTLWEIYKNMNLCLQDDENIHANRIITPSEKVPSTHSKTNPPDFSEPFMAPSFANNNISTNNDAWDTSGHSQNNAELQFRTEIAKNSDDCPDERVLWNLNNAFSYNYSGPSRKRENQIRSKKNRKKRKRNQ